MMKKCEDENHEKYFKTIFSGAILGSNLSWVDASVSVLAPRTWPTQVWTWRALLRWWIRWMTRSHFGGIGCVFSFTCTETLDRNNQNLDFHCADLTTSSRITHALLDRFAICSNALWRYACLVEKAKVRLIYVALQQVGTWSEEALILVNPCI